MPKNVENPLSNFKIAEKRLPPSSTADKMKNPMTKFYSVMGLDKNLGKFSGRS
jgi:hypothetical protein